MSATVKLDLDDTDCCPLGETCAGCGRADVELAVATACVPMGVLCLSICASCADAGTPPSFTLPTAARGVIAHCEHLQVDLDEMAAALATEEDR